MITPYFCKKIPMLENNLNLFIFIYLISLIVKLVQFNKCKNFNIRVFFKIFHIFKSEIIYNLVYGKVYNLFYYYLY